MRRRGEGRRGRKGKEWRGRRGQDRKERGREEGVGRRGRGGTKKVIGSKKEKREEDKCWRKKEKKNGTDYDVVGNIQADQN